MCIKPPPLQVISGADIGNDMYWILVIGGLGIVVGLSTYGYKIITGTPLKPSKCILIYHNPQYVYQYHNINLLMYTVL
jgi:hypothetical protein